MAGPRLEVEIGVKISELTTGLRKAQSDLSKFSSTIQQQTKRTGTIFSSSAKEIAASQQSIAAGAQNWANTIQRSSKAIAPPMMTTQRSMELLGQTAERITKSLQNQGTVVQSVGRQGAAAFRGGTSAAMSFGHILQDIPYGINGVANNITQLVTQLGYMATSAKAAGVSMRAALLSSIANPATIAVLAVSAITTAMVFFRGRVGKAKEATDEFSSSIQKTREEVDKYVQSLSILEQAEIAASNSADQESAKLRILWGLIQDTSTSTRDRARSIQELQNMFPGYFGDLNQEQILTRKGEEAYRKLTAAIIARARATAREEELIDASKQLPGLNKLIESEQKRLNLLDERIERTREENELRRDFGAAAGQPFAGQLTGQAEINRLIKEREELQNRINDLTINRIQLEGSEKVLAREIRDIYNEFGVDTILDDLDSDIASEAIKKTSDDAQKEADRIRQAVEKAYQDGIKASLSARDAEIEATRVKYQELFNLANLSRDQIVQLNEAQANEIIQINEKFDEQERKALEKRNQEIEKAEAKRLDLISKAEQGIRQIREQNAFDLLSEAQQETETIRREYDNRINEAISYYAQLIALAQGSASELIAIQGQLNADLAATEEARGAALEAQDAERRTRMTEAEKKRLKEFENLHREWSRSISSVFEGVLLEGDNVFQALGQAFKRMLAQMVADAIATNIIGALTAGAGGGFLGGLFRFIGGIFGGGFANGGIVSGPTMGLVGEYPGAASNPEVIAPLSELKKYMNNGSQTVDVRVTGEIGNDVIYLSGKRGERAYNRFYKN